MVIKSIPPLLSWFILDANIAGDTQKMYVQVQVLVGLILKFGLTDLCMECIQMLSSGVLTYLL